MQVGMKFCECGVVCKAACAQRVCLERLAACATLHRYVRECEGCHDPCAVLRYDRPGVSMKIFEPASSSYSPGAEDRRGRDRTGLSCRVVLPVLKIVANCVII